MTTFTSVTATSDGLRISYLEFIESGLTFLARHPRQEAIPSSNDPFPFGEILESIRVFIDLRFDPMSIKPRFGPLELRTRDSYPYPHPLPDGDDEVAVAVAATLVRTTNSSMGLLFYALVLAISSLNSRTAPALVGVVVGVGMNPHSRAKASTSEGGPIKMIHPFNFRVKSYGGDV